MDALGRMSPPVLAQLAAGLALQRAVDQDAPARLFQLALGTPGPLEQAFLEDLSADLRRRTPQDLSSALQGCLQNSTVGIAGPLELARGSLDGAGRSYEVIEPQQALEDLRARLEE